MVEHTQPIRWLLLRNCLSVFDHFVGLALKGLKDGLKSIYAHVTVGHMLTGKVFSRTLRRRHSLAESAIFALIFIKRYP